MSTAYFAYGSNMGGVRACGESARFLGVARLDGHRLAFTRRSVRTGTGVADVVPAPGEAVWGALYELSEALLAALDEKEGVGWAYERRAVRVAVEGRGDADAFLYAVLRPEPREVAPSADYVASVVDGARRIGAPSGYVEAIQALAAATRAAEAAERGGARRGPVPGL